MKIGNKPLFVKKNDDVWFKINSNELMYIESKKHGSIFYLNNSDSYFSGVTLRDLKNKLPAGFERVYSSYIVNINYISFIDSKKRVITLTNKKELKFNLKFKGNLEFYFKIFSKKFNSFNN